MLSNIVGDFAAVFLLFDGSRHELVVVIGMNSSFLRRSIAAATWLPLRSRTFA